MTPDQPPLRTTAMTFDSLLDQAAPAIGQYKKTYDHALDLGIRPKDIVLYACGALRADERDRFQSQLLQSPWALSRVVALATAKREFGLVIVKLPDNDEAACTWLDSL
jgi:hypothetical protein